MATQVIHANEMFTVDVTVRESDEYTKAAYLKLELNYGPENRVGTHELFLTPIQLELMGRFLVRQADEIRTAQAYREAI
jgi:hypothetical protein